MSQRATQKLQQADDIGGLNRRSDSDDEPRDRIEDEDLDEEESDSVDERDRGRLGIDAHTGSDRQNAFGSESDSSEKGSGLSTGARIAAQDDNTLNSNSAGGLNSAGGSLSSGLSRLSQPATVQVRSYRVVESGGDYALERSTCSGASLDDALKAPVTAVPVVHDLLGDPEDKADRDKADRDKADISGADGVSVRCNGSAIFEDCRTVDMTVFSATGRSFTLHGRLQATLEPTLTTTPAPVRAPETGKCTIVASETTWGATGGYAGDSSAHHAGDPALHTYNDLNQRNSFLRFDLRQPCSGPNDSWKTLPGGRNLTSVTLHLAYLGKSNSSCWIFPGISYNSQILQPLSTNSTWSEGTLRGNNMPSGANGGSDYKFDVGSPGALTAHTGSGVANAVKQWYKAGGWANNGWILRRDGAGDTCGNSNMFASRSNPNAVLRPKLEITWGP